MSCITRVDCGISVCYVCGVRGLIAVPVQCPPSRPVPGHLALRLRLQWQWPLRWRLCLTRCDPISSYCIAARVFKMLMHRCGIIQQLCVAPSRGDRVCCRVVGTRRCQGRGGVPPQAAQGDHYRPLGPQHGRCHSSATWGSRPVHRCHGACHTPFLPCRAEP